MEYALMRNGEIVNCVMTRASLSKLKQDYPDFEVVPLSQVPANVAQRYRYWNDRP